MEDSLGYPEKNIGLRLIMMTGPPLSLKTEVARALSLFFRAGLVESGCLGVYPSEREHPTPFRQRWNEVREARHDHMKTLIEAYLSTSEPFILDSGFGTRNGREAIYSLVEKHNAGHPEELYDITVVYCHCDVETVFHRRLAERIGDPLNPEPNLEDPQKLIEVQRTYESPVHAGTFDRWSQGPIEVVDYDSASRRIDTLPPNSIASDPTRMIAALIEHRVAIGKL